MKIMGGIMGRIKPDKVWDLKDECWDEPCDEPPCFCPHVPACNPEVCDECLEVGEEYCVLRRKE